MFGLMIEGYSFDGTQSPVVARLGDPATLSSIFSVPSFYGAHGHDSRLRSMSAIFYAAGPSIRQGRTVEQVRNIDIAPTVLAILGIPGPASIDGQVLKKILRHRSHD